MRADKTGQGNEPKGDLAIRVSMLPRDTNPGGTIFGGVILSHLDLAGAIEARKHAEKSFVTVAMTGVEFISPVFVGDVVSFYTRTIRLGRTSVTVGVVVEASRYDNARNIVRVMEAEAVYVAVDASRRPIPVLPISEIEAPSRH
ncbi:MAG: acyl-CoA thioesterase [Acidobacteria bacterium]|nr:acyl-CoA thioesterase [Acidobacteriota bacterium]